MHAVTDHLTIESLTPDDKLVWLMTYAAARGSDSLGPKRAARRAWAAVREWESVVVEGAPPRPRPPQPDPEQR